MERTRMNIKRSVTWGLLAGAAACVAVAAMPGCELLVDFDRSKIPTDDGSVGDDVAESPDAPAGSSDGASEGSTPAADAGADATSTSDAALDAGDSGQAAPGTGTPDTGVDTGTPDTGTDASSGVDAGVDSGPDAVADSGADAE
jgi:hypothetical protein